MTASTSNEQLLRDYATSGNRVAMENLVSRYIDFVYAAARRELAGDADAADDVTQAVFLVFARKAGSVPPHRIGGWLFRAVRYAAADHRKLAARRRRHEQAAAFERTEVQGMSHSHVHGGDGEDTETLLPLLNDALGSLSAADREAVILRYFREVEFAQLAADIGTSEVAARKRVTRAVAKLRKLFALRMPTSAQAPAIIAVLALAASEKAPAATVAAVGSTLTSAVAASSAVVGISAGVANMIFWAKAKVAAGLLIAAALLTGVIAEAGRRALAESPATAAAAVAPPPAAPARPAEASSGIGKQGSDDVLAELFKRLEKAQTAQVVYRTELTGPQKMTFAGTFVVAAEGRVRCSMQMSGEQVSQEVIAVSDGRRMATFIGGRPADSSDRVQSSQTWLAWLARGGAALPMLTAVRVPPGQQPPPFNADVDLAVHDLKEVAKELQGVAAKPYSYTLKGPSFPEPAQVTLWMDTATSLPVRREIVMQGGVILTEMYSGWKLGEALDAALFETSPKPTENVAASPVTVATDYYAALTARDYPRALKLVTEKYPLAKLEQMQAMLKVEEAKLELALVGNEQSLVTTREIPSRDAAAARTGRWGLTLRKQPDGRWLIRDFDFLPTPAAVDGFVRGFRQVEPQAREVPVAKTAS